MEDIYTSSRGNEVLSVELLPSLKHLCWTLKQEAGSLFHHYHNLGFYLFIYFLIKVEWFDLI